MYSYQQEEGLEKEHVQRKGVESFQEGNIMKSLHWKKKILDETGMKRGEQNSRRKNRPSKRVPRKRGRPQKRNYKYMKR